MVLVLAVNDNTVLPHPAAAIEKNRSESPFVIDFDLLEEFHREDLGILAMPWLTRQYIRP
jgi:hypothetical protein